MTVPPDIQQIIQHYYPVNIRSNQAAYYVTPEHQRLRRARAEAEKKYQPWGEMLQQIRHTFPEYGVQDVSNLSYNNCYQGEMSLYPQRPFGNDEVNFVSDVHERRLILRLLVSILGPFYHLYIEENRYDLRTEVYHCQVIKPENRFQTQIVSRVQAIVNQQGYQLVDPTILAHQLPYLTTEFKTEGQVTVGDCLFSDTGQYRST